MGILVGSLKLFLKLIIYFALFVTIILVIPNLPPYTKFSHIKITPTKERSGALTPNNVLNNSSKLYENKLLGPECFQIWRDELYTSLATGEVVKVSSSGHVTFVTKIGQPCTGLVQEHVCGRPLGFTIDERNSVMYVADAYYGIWKVDLRTDKKQVLVPADVAINGKTPKLFNSVVFDKKGGVYWTTSGSDYDLKDGVFITLSDPTGRLMYHNPSTKENKVLLDDIWFPNGLALSPDESFIVVAETMQYRLLKYYINGPKKGKAEVFVDGLPGTPDNIRALPDGSGIQIALYAASDENTPMIIKSLANAPLARKFLLRLSLLLEKPFVFLNSQFPNPIFEEIIYKIGHFSSMSGLVDGTGLVLTDWNGNVVASYYNTDRSLSHISDAIVYNNKLMLGCPHKQNFIGAVDVPPLLKEKYSNIVKDNIKLEKSPDKELPKKVTTERPQTTTTEKPQPKPQSKTTTDKPQSKITTEKPQSKTTTDKPQTKTATEKPQSKTTTDKPQTKPTTQMPPTKSTTTTTAKPQIKTTTEKPATKPTTQAPQTKPMPTQKVTSPPQDLKKEQPKPVPEIKLKENVIDAKAKTETKDAKKSQDKVDQASKQTNNIKTDSGKTEKAAKAAKEVKKENVKGQSKENSKAEAKHIPIEEDIVSDTVKPSKEKLKVIKKSGPVEIPNPEL